MKKLTVLEASKICGFSRSYFYSILRKYNVTISKHTDGKSYIDPSELVRAIPSHLINADLLTRTTSNNEIEQDRTESNNKTEQKRTTQNNDETDVNNELRAQIKILSEQLEYLKEQNNTLLDTVSRTTLLLEQKRTTSNNEIEQYRTESNNNTEQKRTTQNNTELTSIFDKMRTK